jgi:hypothetical protein
MEKYDLSNIKFQIEVKSINHYDEIIEWFKNNVDGQTLIEDYSKYAGDKTTSGTNFWVFKQANNANKYGMFPYSVVSHNYTTLEQLKEQYTPIQTEQLFPIY